LDSFDREVRRDALDRLIAEYGSLIPPEGINVNMHFHSFFSYNASGYSPSRIAWEARKAGLYAAGLCDFDVLDGLEEFLEAGRLLGLRTTVNLETHAYLKEYADADISSPGEQGVTYIMGAAFPRMVEVGTPPATGLQGYRDRARARNVALVGRINPHIGEITIDYEEDVLPLAPAGAATERHIVSAYISKSKAVLEHADSTAKFWSKVLKTGFEETVELMADEPRLEEAVRARLVKRGGFGYEPPSVDTFPPVDTFIDWVASCDAMPMITWLDGTSGGEDDGRAMLECMRAKGAVALNIIPDRNWNISDPDTRKIKTEKLDEITAIAADMQLPINIGTEMNKLGLPFTDDLTVEYLAPHREVFTRGARIMVGHTLLARYAGFSYIGEKAAAEFKDKREKNDFFEKAGALAPIGVEQAQELEAMGQERAYTWLQDMSERNT